MKERSTAGMWLTLPVQLPLFVLSMIFGLLWACAGNGFRYGVRYFEDHTRSAREKNETWPQ